MPTLDASADLLRLLGDPTRVRLLALLAEEELTVAELTRLTRLGQPRVSTHLGRLKEAGLVRHRRNGTASYYRLDPRMPREAARLWSLVKDTAADPLLEQDRVRLRAMLRSRASWAEAVAGTMERHYSPGRTWEASLRGLLGVVALGDVLDVGSGDCALAELLAPRARSTTCLDRSGKVIAAGRRRGLPRARFVRADMHELPFPRASFDHVLLLNCLTHAEQPGRVVGEAARVLRPGGNLAAVTLHAHAHVEAAARYDHVRPGFVPDELAELFRAAGLATDLCAVTSRERRPPHFEIVTVHARRPA